MHIAMECLSSLPHSFLEPLSLHKDVGLISEYLSEPRKEPLQMYRDVLWLRMLPFERLYLLISSRSESWHYLSSDDMCLAGDQIVFPNYRNTKVLRHMCSIIRLSVLTFAQEINNALFKTLLSPCGLSNICTSRHTSAHLFADTSGYWTSLFSLSLSSSHALSHICLFGHR